jgi:antitoxin component of MazEF toxin-antitoxin module
MKTMNVKSDNSAAIEAFLSRGGKITKCPTKRKEKRTREVKVVEIDVEALPKDLLKYVQVDEVA